MCVAGYWPRLVPQEQHDECFQVLCSIPRVAGSHYVSISYVGFPVLIVRHVLLHAGLVERGSLEKM